MGAALPLPFSPTQQLAPTFVPVNALKNKRQHMRTSPKNDKRTLRSIMLPKYNTSSSFFTSICQGSLMRTPFGLCIQCCTSPHGGEVQANGAQTQTFYNCPTPSIDLPTLVVHSTLSSSCQSNLESLCTGSWCSECSGRWYPLVIWDQLCTIHFD